MSHGRPTRSDVSNSYHPRGFDESASLQRARKPFLTRNFITGTAVLGFIVGVYAYSISAVKQDDFSDVVDLLPPAAERQNIRTIEDETREAALLADALRGTAPVLEAEGLVTPSASLAAAAEQAPRASVLSYLSPKRLSEVAWVKKTGLVEEGKGNLLVWGAPNVDKIGNMRESGDSRGRRLV